MNSHFLPTLLHMTAVKTALALHHDKDLGKMLDEQFHLPLTGPTFHREKYELWTRIETKASDKLCSIPTTLQIRVPKYMKPIQEETRRWVVDHSSLLMLSYTDCYQICKNILYWKSDGTVDRKQTAKQLIEMKYFGIPARFAVACTYFLEDELWALWCSNKEEIESFMPHRSANGAMRFCLEHLRKGSWRNKSWIPKIDEYFQELFPRRHELRLRMSCFFPYLSWENKKEYFPLLLDNNHGDDLRLCMLAMNERERIEMLHKYPASSLISCLEWPLQSFFMELANQLCSHMGTEAFKGVLHTITLWYIIYGYEDFDYVTLLKDFWDVIPSDNKDEIKTDKRFYAIIEIVFKYDKGNARMSLPETMEESVDLYSSRIS